MAFVVMTSTQKDEMISNAAFIREVKWAILDKADYWSSHDGNTPPGGLERWRKAKGLAKIIQEGPSIAENSNNVKIFLENLKNVQCVDNAIDPYVAQNTIERLLATSQFDAASDKWFDLQIARTL